MKKGDLRRQAILDTAEALFFERGYEETSVQDILDAMELSKGGFYHHFESKMAVLEAVSARRARSSLRPSLPRRRWPRPCLRLRKRLIPRPRRARRRPRPRPK